MPIDRATASVVVAAPLETVLGAVRDVTGQVDWVSEITEAELVEEYEDGTPATARFEMTTRLGVDRYTLEYEHADDAMTWVMADGGMQKAQTGAYRLRDLGDGRTEVTLALEVEHSIAAPGFLRRKIFQGVVEGNLASLKTYLEG
jgi:Polyketide cyclase / dehydrase and lipid transport